MSKINLKIMRLVFILSLVFTINSCDVLLSSGDDFEEDIYDYDSTADDGTGNGITSSAFSINLDGATALFTKTSEKSRGMRSNTRSTSSSPLAKILEDGSVEDVFNFSDDAYVPDISFIAIGPKGGVYIYFDYSIGYYDSNNDYKQLQFIKIYNDNTFEIIEESGYIKDFSWGWGAGEDQDPIIFDDNGGIFYAIYNYENSSYALKKYYENETTELTTSSNIYIEAFFTDGTDLFFLGRNNTADNNSSFLRVVYAEDGTTEDIFYDTSYSSWIRDVQQTDIGLIIHGYNIPNPNPVEDKLSGLLKLSKVDGEWNWENLITQQNTSGSSQYKLEEDIFLTDDELDEDLITLFFEPFFDDNIVPSDLDPFEVVNLWYSYSDNRTYDHNVDEFFYLLLKDYTGFNKTAFENLDLDSYISATPNFSNLYDKSSYTYKYTLDSLYYEDDGSIRTDINFVDKLFYIGDSYDNSNYLDSYSLKDGKTFPEELSFFSGDSTVKTELLEYLDLTFNEYTPILSTGSIMEYVSSYYDDDDVYHTYYYSPVTGYDTTTRVINKLKELNPDLTFTIKKGADGKDLELTEESIIPYNMYTRTTEWEWEGDGTETYDQTSEWGNYRIINNEDQNLNNFFDIDKTSYTSSNLYLNTGMFNSESGYDYDLKDEYLTNGEVDSDAIKNYLDGYRVTYDIPDDISEIKNYFSSNYYFSVDELETLLSIEAEELPDSFDAYYSNIYTWYNAPNDTFTVNYNYLQNFTYSEDTKEIFGLFGSNYSSDDGYTIVKLLNSDNEICEDIIQESIKTTNVKIVDNSAYYSSSDSSGAYSISKIDLEDGSEPEILLDTDENLELFKYDISSVTNQIFFTARDKTANIEKVGFIDLSTLAIEYNNSDGLGSSSDITIYTAD